PPGYRRVHLPDSRHGPADLRPPVGRLTRRDDAHRDARNGMQIMTSRATLPIAAFACTLLIAS
ncbi:MAG: hypothetical protein ABIV06_08285, partial [Thermoanaerobaculia bacterium]